MSDVPDPDLLAAEYVLGVLEGEELEEATRLLAADASFAAAVRAWETRLAPLSASSQPIPPPAGLWEHIETSIDAAGPSPGLWDRIDAATAPAVVSLASLRRLLFWQAASGVSLAIAASLAAFIFLRSPSPSRVAVLAPTSGKVSVLLATEEPDGRLSIFPDGTVSVPDGRDLELWALRKGETRPQSLGVLPAEGRRFVATIAPGTQLLVSLEPRGGSPTGQPTGPVLYGGHFTAPE
jgi:anti-sigma-K factor RskA